MKHNIPHIIPYVLLFLAILCAVFLKLLPYSLHEYAFVIGFDAGKYINNLGFHTSASIQTLDLWIEPGLNTTLVFLDTLLEQNPSFYFVYFLPILISIILPMLVFLCTQKLTKSALSSAFAAFFLATSTIFLNATFDAFYRQLYATILFLTFFYIVIPPHEQTSDTARLSLLALFGSGVILSHRGITLLLVMLLGILFLHALMRKQISEMKHIVAIGIGAVALSAIYWGFILKENIIVLTEAVQNSIKGTSGGERVIKKLTRNDNQITGYVTQVTSAFFPLFGMAFLFVKQKANVTTIFLIFLVLYIFLRATFSNRLMVNLDMLFAVAAGVAFFYLQQMISKKFLMFLATSVMLFNFVSSVQASLDREPYVPTKTNAFLWVEKNIYPTHAIVFAPDALATIFAQMQYHTALNDYPVKLGGGGLDSATINEQFLVTGYKDVSLLEKLPPNITDVYVVFGDWNLTNPLPRAEKLIDMQQWDRSRLFSLKYKGDAYLRRVYYYHRGQQ